MPRATASERSYFTDRPESDADSKKRAALETEERGAERAINEPLAIAMLVHGHRYRDLARFAGFTNAQQVQAFARREDVRVEVRRQLGEQARRLSGKALVRLERALDDRQLDPRCLTGVIRTALEVGTLIGFYREPVSTKHVQDLSAGELAALIRQTRSELDSRQVPARISTVSQNNDLEPLPSD